MGIFNKLFPAYSERELKKIQHYVDEINALEPKMEALSDSELREKTTEFKNRIKNGETLMLGGLIYEKETQNVSKIPILGDIPALGVFFRNTNNEKQKNELVIMITPRIIDDTEDAVDI